MSLRNLRPKGIYQRSQGAGPKSALALPGPEEAKKTKRSGDGRVEMNGLPSSAASISPLLLAATEMINVAKARLGHG